MATAYKYTPQIHEILARANELTGEPQREYLYSKRYDGLLKILDAALNDYQYLIPTPRPHAFSPPSPESVPTSLHSKARHLGDFLAGGILSKLPNDAIQLHYVNLLENIHPEDALLVIAIVEGSFSEKYPNITRDSVNRAFPGLLGDSKVQAEAPEAEEVSNHLNIGNVGAWTLSELPLDVFDDLRKAVQREAHARKKANA